MITEAQFTQQIRDLAIITGWRFYHTWNSRNSAAGYPDITLCRGSRLIMVELQTDIGKVTKAQQDWLDALKATGIEVYCWRPRDFDGIVETLKVGSYMERGVI